MKRRDVLHLFWLFVTACGQRIAGVGKDPQQELRCKTTGLLLARDGQCVEQPAAAGSNRSQDQAGGAQPSTPGDGNPQTGAQMPGGAMVSPGAVSGELAGLKVAIDVGHGLDDQGWDSGAVSRGLVEYELNSKEAALVAQHLRAKGAQVSVFDYTRDGSNPKYPLRQRGGRASGHDLFLSIHHNAAGSSAQGTEVLYHPDGTAKDRRLAGAIQKKMVEHVWKGNSSRDRSTKVMRLAILGGVPKSVDACCLTEAFFITASDATAASAGEWVQAAALAVAEGIAEYWKTRNSALSLVDELFNDGPFEETPDPEGLYKNH